MPMKEKKSMRPKARPKTFGAGRPKARPRDVEKSRGEMMAREEIRRRSAVPPTEESITRGLDERGEMMSGYADGGMVRGCKGVQTSGKAFRGTY